MKATLRRIYFVLFLSSLFFVTIKAAEEMPIIAFWGVPDTMSYERCFKDFSDCGFTVSIYPYWKLDTLVKACKVADKYGVKIIGRCPEIFDAPIKTAKTLKTTKGFMGYMLQDEPSIPDMHERKKDIERISSIDNTHLFYINLLPYYRQDWFVAAAKTDSYEDYLTTASTIDCQQISFDFYPITTEGIRPTWYHNLEMIRQNSLSAKKPFWGFVLSTPHSAYPQPTLASLRLQVYSNLAYGAQAIQYFTYWSPTPRNYDYHNAPIGVDGKKTKTWELVKQMNHELKTVSKLFYGAKVLSVHHLGAIPEGTTRQKQMPENIRSLKIVGKQGAIISRFEKDGHRYLAIVNKSHERTLTVRIRTRNNIPQHLTKTLDKERIKTNYTVDAGDILLFKLK
jgi:hypothetical protein